MIWRTNANPTSVLCDPGAGEALCARRGGLQHREPTLSSAIRKLEEDLQVVLVIRGHRFMGLTPDGERCCNGAAASFRTMTACVKG